jgi:hypothetical protein
VRFWLWLFLAGAGLNIVVGLPAWPAVLSGHLNDPDSYMRLERILQGVQAGHLTNWVARDGPGRGVLVEWSRLMDAALWALAAPVALFAGWRDALFWVGVATGPLIAGLLGVSLAFVAEPFVARRFLWLLPVAAALLPALANYAGPGVVTHHVLLLALIALTAGCVARADLFDTAWNFLAGATGGLAIWLTPEAMPFVLLCYGLLFLRWLQRPAGAGLAACGAGLFDVLGFAFAIDPPAGGYGAAETDRLSIIFVLLGLALLLTGVLLWRLEKWPDPRLRRAAGLLAALALLGGWLALFPKLLAGPYGLMSAADVKLFFGVIGEMQPAGFNPVSFGDLWPGIVGLVIAVWLALTGRDIGAWYGLAALALVFVLGVKFLRFAPVASAAGAVLAAVALQDMSARLAEKPALAAAGRISILALLLLVPLLGGLAHGASRPAPTPASAQTCDLAPFAPALQAANGKIILADPNDSPEILWRSQASVVGSLYHHGVAGFLALRSAWRATPGAAPPPAVTATGASFVLFCPAAGRTLLVADLPRTTLWDALLAGRPPGWLHLVATARSGGYRLYAIIPGH